MADKKLGKDGDNAAAEARAGLLPITVNAQYIKDLSIENPNAPMSLRGAQGAPQVNMHVDVRGSRLKGEGLEDSYEVVLNIRAEAKNGEETAFIVELSYGGVFTLAEVPAEQRNPALLIAGPTMLFPFARAIIADATRDAGYPPLMVNPIDFADLYRRQLTEQIKRAQAAQGEKAEAAVN
jgi:preprotein translocase subunit SecB